MGVKDSEDLHRYTRSRFVSNEATEMAQRYAHFDIKHLVDVAAQAVGSASCAKAEKLAEGAYNKALLLTMDDGKQVVARVPNPNAGQAYLTTASEVATMKYARDVLHHPVPKIYTYNCNASQSPVGAEYIIMEKARGVPLDTVWAGLDLASKWAVTQAVAELEEDWSSAAFHGYGSLYHASDLAMSTRQIRQPQLRPESAQEDQHFVLGPTTGREWNSHGRSNIQCDRGPCEEYMNAIGERELASVVKMTNLPPSLLTLRGPKIYETSREKKSTAIQWYLDLVPHLIPVDIALKKPCIWHPDLHTENIFVDPSNPTKITSIIDWQSTQVAPMFSQARQPYFLDYEGPQHFSIEEPELPKNFDQLSNAEKRKANTLLIKQGLLAAYRRWHHFKNPDIWSCFVFRQTPQHNLLLVARNLLVDGEATFMARVVELAKTNPDLLGTAGRKILSSLRPEDLKQIEKDSVDAYEGMNVMQSVLDAMGDIAPRHGVVSHGNYEEVKCALQQLKEQIMEQYAQTEEEKARWEEAWPFDD